MQIPGRNIYSLLISIMILLSSCSTAKNRPYECGFVLRKMKHIRGMCGPFLEHFELKSGDVVASIGASNGWYEGALSTLTDNVTFYLEDIDTLCLNNQEIGNVVKHYSSVRGKPITNQFIPVIGTEKTTELPDGIFDAIIISVSFHHFTYPAEMMDDIRKKLNPGGKLFIIENVVKETGQVLKSRCMHPLKSEADLKTEFESYNCMVLLVIIHQFRHNLIRFLFSFCLHKL